jgi:hypothetical protein
MVRLNQLSNWDGQDDEVIPIVIQRKDTDISDDHWDEFAEYATYSDTSTWDAALEQMERVYEEWKEETFCDECDERYEYDCECNNEEEEEEDE